MPGSVYRRGNYWFTRWGSRTYRHSTKTLAIGQLRLLEGIKHGTILPRRIPKGGSKKGRSRVPGPRYPT